jgi:DNA-binding transcriptional LysR family regulator
LALERQGVKRNSLHIVMELDSTEAIKSAVEAGLGVGFISRWAIAKDPGLGNNFKIVEVEGLSIKREFLVAYASGPEPQGPQICHSTGRLAEISVRPRRS